MLGFVTSDDPMYVTFAHSPERYPALGHRYDDKFFAFVGNDHNSTMALRLRVPRQPPKSISALPRSPTTTLRRLPPPRPCFSRASTAPAPLRLARRTSSVATYLWFLPTYLWFLPASPGKPLPAAGSPLKPSTPPCFIQPFLTEVDFLVVNYTALTHWRIAATTDRAAHGAAAAAANHSALEIDVSKDGNYAAQAQLLGWGQRVTDAVLARAPAGARSAHWDAVLSRTELTAQRAANHEAPNFSDRFGTAASEALIALLGVPSVDDLPNVFITLGANKKNRNTDCNVIKGVLTARSQSNNSPADALTAPTVTPSILTLLRKQRQNTETPVIGERSEERRVGKECWVEGGGGGGAGGGWGGGGGGGTALSASDVARLSKNLLALPMNKYMAYEQLVGFTVLVDVISGRHTLVPLAYATPFTPLALFLPPISCLCVEKATPAESSL